MKTIGLIGGTTWESTITYYEVINETVKEHMGGYHSAKCALYSVDFHEIDELQKQGDWDKIAAMLSGIARRLEAFGADLLVLCANTMHKVADEVEAAISIPLFHVADITAREIKSCGINKAILMGTKYTMEEEFYSDRLAQNGVEAIVPDKADREYINSVIFNELCYGIVSQESKNRFIDIIEKLAAKGAPAAILGCTELGLLIKQKDTSVRLFDTALLHAQKAALYSMGVYEY